MSSSSPKSKIHTIKTIVSTIGTVATTVMVVRSVAKDYLPPEFRDYIYLGLKSFIKKCSTHLTIVIYESDDFKPNEIYKAAEQYISTKMSLKTNRLKVTKTPNQEHPIQVSTDENLEFTDTYNEVKLYWSSDLDHPSTFATLAMDTDIKEKVMKDLDRFIARRDYYRRVGKAWKRGYLLYGPPGTGKSSLIAAMANYLNFDIYDLDLSTIKFNTTLRSLLVATENRSILVVEDIDCSVELHDRVSAEHRRGLAQDNHHGYRKEGQVTLSGFLNFIDGLWSSCGDERIIIFTTNRKDKLDPALLRPGRMDVHINMSYCTPSGFRLLASNYLGITQHDLFGEIEDLIRKVEITPAEVAEQLLKDDDPDISLCGLIDFFDIKKKQNEKAKAKEEENLAAKESEKIQELQKYEN
ncbi:ATPase, AAA-type, core [Artemisia annua]|uniref:ATPase, AAA-type, core n=1 Tax=Artemisia annua TaxID=35608 RepID=A0A2U1NAA5_ARTAN|nr:ATPase, AAA-type, core [Artemisia annua]